MNWLDTLRIEDLPEIYQEIAEKMSLEIAVQLSEILGGSQPYFPQTETLFSKTKKRYIIAHFTGNNHAELAQATDLCVREVYQVLKEHRERRQPGLFPTAADL
ncbi:MAG: hypothetical protein M0024_01425 [Nitrospiraceae bacterium]|nr:hypothetical protein [Nitrospiraceae bacterium]